MKTLTLFAVVPFTVAVFVFGASSLFIDTNTATLLAALGLISTAKIVVAIKTCKRPQLGQEIFDSPHNLPDV